MRLEQKDGVVVHARKTAKQFHEIPSIALSIAKQILFESIFAAQAQRIRGLEVN
jgi:hypothetical protein